MGARFSTRLNGFTIKVVITKVAIIIKVNVILISCIYNGDNNINTRNRRTI